MDVEWQDNSLVVKPNGDGERRVLESVVDSLISLKRTDLNYRSPSGPIGHVEPVDDQSISPGVNKLLKVIPQSLR
jgi:hypothetical protein